MIRFSALPHRLHFKKPAATSRGALVDRDLWLIEARADETPQHTGIGETDFGETGIGEAGIVPGLSVDDLPDLGTRIQVALETLNAAQLALPAPTAEPLGDITLLLAPFRELLAPLPALHFGIECALLHLLQGNRGILFPTPFTAGNATLPTHGLIWMDTPAALLAQVQAKVDAGFTVIKMKVGADTWQQELALLTTMRARVPPLAVRRAATCSFPPCKSPSSKSLSALQTMPSNARANSARRRPSPSRWTKPSSLLPQPATMQACSTKCDRRM